MNIQAMGEPVSSQRATPHKSDPAAEIRHLEQRRESLEKELKQLKESGGGQTAKARAEKLQKEIEEINKQIQALQQQSAAAEPEQKSVPKEAAPSFDEYIKGDESMQTEGAGTYYQEKDEDGKIIIKSTVDTSAIDSQVRHLEQEKQNIVQELQREGGTINSQEENTSGESLRRELEEIETLIEKLKSPEYRKQHGSVTQEQVAGMGD